MPIGHFCLLFRDRLTNWGVRMRLNSLLAYLMGCIALALPCLIYFKYIYRLGFPDGFITELEYAERRLAYIFIVISLTIGSYFMYLGKMYLGKGAGRKAISKRLSATIIVYLAFIISLTLLDYYYHLHLTGGRGG
jgi:hypothetical protein